MESFKFRLSKELVHEVGYDVEYEAKESDIKRFIAVWVQPPGGEKERFLYKEHEVQEMLDDGDWIKIN